MEHLSVLRPGLYQVCAIAKWHNSDAVFITTVKHLADIPHEDIF